MKLKLKQKLFSLFRQQYEIKDMEENLAFYIKPLFSFFPKFEIHDKNNALVLIVKQRPFRFLKRYDVLNDKKELLFSVKQKFTFFVPKAKIKNKKEDKQLSISGNILAHEFDICEKDEIKATVSKKYISITDSYVIDIFDEPNAALYIAFAMIYDAIYFGSGKRKFM